MDDLQRQPRDGDRNPVRDRIKSAVADGRISAADGNIRLTNVGSARSMSELDLIVRDLDQLDATVRPAAPVGAPVGAPAAPVPSAPRPSGRSWLPVVVGVIVLVVLGGIGGLVLAVVPSSSHSTSSGPDLPDVLPITASPTAGVPDSGPGSGTGSGDPASPAVPQGPAYRLTADGVTTFLKTYRAKFSTSKTIDLTLYDDYVVAQVPVPGKDRHSGWLYRDGKFGAFGGVTANFPGSAAVDLRKLDVAAMMRNVAKARRTLKVEAYNQTYVVIDYRPQFDTGPNVNIYVANKYNESGYLATTLDGSVERAFPYGS